MNDRNHEAKPKHALTLMRVLRADGLEVNGLRYQSADLHKLRKLAVDRSVKVRIDPQDVRHVFVRDRSQWIPVQLRPDDTASDKPSSSAPLRRWVEAGYAARIEDDRT